MKLFKIAKSITIVRSLAKTIVITAGLLFFGIIYDTPILYWVGILILIALNIAWSAWEIKNALKTHPPDQKEDSEQRTHPNTGDKTSATDPGGPS